MTANLRQAAGSLLVVGLGGRVDGPGTRVAQAGSAWRHHSLPAQHRECRADPRAAQRRNCALRARVSPLRGCRRWNRGSPARRTGAIALRASRCCDRQTRPDARTRRVGGAGSKGIRIQYNTCAGARSGPDRFSAGHGHALCCSNRCRSSSVCARVSCRAGGARRCRLRQALPRTGRRHARLAPGNACDSAQHARALARGSCALSRVAQRTAHGDGESRSLSAYAEQGSARQRLALLDYDGAA